MSTKPNDGGPAFPVQDAEKWQGHGMTLRDYFAAKAMQGMCSGGRWPDGYDRPEIAERAYLMADAMLKARDE